MSAAASLLETLPCGKPAAGVSLDEHVECCSVCWSARRNGDERMLPALAPTGPRDDGTPTLIRWDAVSHTFWRGFVGDDVLYRLQRFGGWWRIEFRSYCENWPNGVWLPLRCRLRGSLYRQPPPRRFSSREDAFAACEEHASRRADR